MLHLANLAISHQLLSQGNRDEVGWEKVDFYGQTEHRSYEEKQDNPGDWEAWTSQGPMNVHKREYLGLTDEGVTLLRDKLRRDIRAVANGEDIAMPQGTPEKPFHTYGGDTVLRIPKDNQDDRAMIDRVQRTVADIYFAGDAYEGEDRSEFICREVSVKFE